MFFRLAQVEVDTSRAVAGVVGGFLGWWYPDVFGGLFILLVAAMAIDWFYGRRHALYANRYSRTASRNGLYSKGGTLMIVAMLRTLEYLLPGVGLPEFTGLGIGGSFICLALLADEIESIEDHIVALGGRRLPVLGVIFARIRAVTGASRRVKGDDNPPGAGPRLELRGESLGGDP